MTYRSYSANEIIKLKTKEINSVEKEKIEKYIKEPRSPKDGYIKELYDVTLSQIIIKAGFRIETYPTGVDDSGQRRLEYLANRLTTHYLKRKLELIKKPEQFAFKPESVILDPHHHLNSIYAKDNSHLLSLLPDFGAIYEALRDVPRNPRREQEIREQSGVLTDIQFLGRPPTSLKGQDGSQRLNPTVGYVRGPYINDVFKEGWISQYADKHKGVCRCCDMCGPETKDSLPDLKRYLDVTIKCKAEIIRVHIGETHIPTHGKHNVEQLFQLLDQERAEGKIKNQVIRLGHGTHMGFQSMTEAAKHGYYVEACLSSNKETGIIGKRKEYPLGPMLLLGVKVMIGTDGGELYYTELKTEYAHAEKNIEHFLNAIKIGASEVVTLTNGDNLQYKHLKELFKEIPQANGWHDDKCIEFADLKLIEEICKQKISMLQLVENMSELKGKIFPQGSEKVKIPQVKAVGEKQSPHPKDLFSAFDGHQYNTRENLEKLHGLIGNFLNHCEQLPNSAPNKGELLSHARLALDYIDISNERYQPTQIQNTLKKAQKLIKHRNCLFVRFMAAIANVLIFMTIIGAVASMYRTGSLGFFGVFKTHRDELLDKTLNGITQHK